MSQPIPQPPGLPLVGNVLDINTNNTWASLKTLAEKYGEIFQIKVLGHTVVFVAGAALAEELCDEKRFRKYVGGPIVEIRYAVHDALFTAFDHEASWGIAHRIIAPKLSTASITERFDDMNDTATELLAKWKGLGTNNKISPIGELNRLNLEATTFALFGKRLHCLEGPEHPMLKAMEDSTSEAMKRPNRPGFLNWLVHGKKFKSATATMRAYAADLVKHRKENPTDRDDCLTAMLDAKDPETGIALTESQVIDEIVSMPIGSSTAPCLVSTAIYLMLKNPHVIATARKEIDAVVGAGELTHAHISQLPYIAGLVRESLRLAFPAPGFNIEPIPSESKAPVLLGGGRYQVAHDQAMILVLAGVNRDANVFEDPLAFRPERMVGEAYEKLPAGVKKGFGNGKRECIGKHYAWLWLMTIMTRLIKEVDFEMADANYELHMDGWFNVRPVDFFVNVKPRAA
ncbi:cytochrome P450 [Thelonectria olida]|uniref:Bifunctional cytochrome P450/NADPH--P450 reductase n=1 Tax=Thelonectria olida TaxID=1576542 RepID=A0A9P8W3G7_9HYPO|nr:cytochrome P450 [Thelonectria olida]